MENHKYQSSSSSINTWLFALIILVAAAIGHIGIRMNANLHADEGFHAGQIWLFYDGKNELAGNITVPPTYHFVIGKIVKFTGGYHDNLLRLISLVIGLLSVPAIFLAARFYNPSEAWLRTLQVYFTPLIFPYFFVLYTDIWSLGFVALTFMLTLQRKYVAAGLAGGGAILIRQDNVAWVGMAYLYMCFESINKLDRATIGHMLTNALLKGLTFNLVFVGFLIFVYLNGGVAIGDAAAHPISAFNPSNIHVFLICCWLLFLPLHIMQIPKILPLLRNQLVVLGLIAGLFIYLATLKNTHSYNQILYSYFIHNGLVHLLTDYPAIKVISYFLAAWTLLSFFTMELPDRRWYWLLLVIPFATISHPLIEARYYIPAFFLIHILRPRLPYNIEILMLMFYIAISAFFLYGTTTDLIFL